MSESRDEAALRARTHAEERAIMDRYAPVFRAWTVTNGLLYQNERSAFVRWALDQTRRAGEDPRRLRWLDVGCATGELIEVLRAEGCRRVIGLDLSAAMVREARRHIPDVSAVVGTIEDAPFAPAAFDVVLTSFTVHHLAEPAAFFERARHLLVPDGWIFALEYNADSWALRQGSREQVRLLSSPLRAILGWKNHAALAAGPREESTFNPSHRLLGVRALRAAAEKSGFRCDIVTRGLVGPWILNELVADRRLDRVLLRAIEPLERLPRPFAAGAFQLLCGRR